MLRHWLGRDANTRVSMACMKDTGCRLMQSQLGAGIWTEALAVPRGSIIASISSGRGQARTQPPDLGGALSGRARNTSLRGPKNTAPPDLDVLSKTLALPSGRSRNAGLRASENSVPPALGSHVKIPKKNRRNDDVRSSEMSAPPYIGSRRKTDFRSSEASALPNLGSSSRSPRPGHTARNTDFRSSASAAEGARTRNADFRSRASAAEGRRPLDESSARRSNRGRRLRRSTSAAGAAEASEKPLGQLRRRTGSVEDRRRQGRAYIAVGAALAPLTLSRGTLEPIAPPTLSRGTSDPIAAGVGCLVALKDGSDPGAGIPLSVAERRQRRRERQDGKERLSTRSRSPKREPATGASTKTAMKDSSKSGKERSPRLSTRQRRCVQSILKNQLAQAVDNIPALRAFANEGSDEEPDLFVNKRKSVKPKRNSEAVRKSTLQTTLEKKKYVAEEDGWSITPTTMAMASLGKEMETTKAAAGRTAEGAASLGGVMKSRSFHNVIDLGGRVAPSGRRFQSEHCPANKPNAPAIFGPQMNDDDDTVGFY